MILTMLFHYALIAVAKLEVITHIIPKVINLHLVNLKEFETSSMKKSKAFREKTMYYPDKDSELLSLFKKPIRTP